MYVITNIDMISNAHRTCQDAALADHHTARDAHAGYDRRILADLAVVADLDQIIDHHSICDDGISDRTPVDCRDRTDLNVVANTQPAMLGDSHPVPFFLRVAKSVTAEHRPAFDEATLTDDDATHHRNVGKKTGLCAQFRPLGNHAARPDNHTVSNNSIILDYTVCADRGRRTDRRAVCHHSAWMNAGLRDGCVIQQPCGTGVPKMRVLTDNRSALPGIPIFLTKNHG